MFDAAQHTELLKRQDYEAIDTSLRTFIDQERNHAAVDWMNAGASLGHALLLYHSIRNAAKESTGTVLSTTEFEAAFQKFVLLMLRVAQDVNAIRFIHGTELRCDLFRTLFAKILAWFKKFDGRAWPAPGKVADRLETLGCVREPEVLPSPAWVTSCEPARVLWFGGHISFGAPAPLTVNACRATKSMIHEVRKTTRDAFLSGLRAIEAGEDQRVAWTTFFTERTSESFYPTSPPSPPPSPLSTRDEDRPVSEDEGRAGRKGEGTGAVPVTVVARR